MDDLGNLSANEIDADGSEGQAMTAGVAAPVRRGPGKPPGHPKPPGSGRKRGTPNRSTAEIRAIAQKHGPKAIRELIKLMTTSPNEATRMKAAQELLDRGYGRPVSPTELTGRDGAPLAAQHAVDSAEVARRIAFLLRRGAVGE